MRRYGLKSIDSLIEGIGDDVVSLLAKKREGAKVDLAIRNKREIRKKYRKSRTDMGTRMKLEGDLSVGEISVVGIARVVPLSDDASYLKEAALDRAMRFERRTGRKPELVSGTGRGFDIRSVGRRGTVRYILAKPAPRDEPVVFTFNEWFRARTLGAACYLYLLRDGRNDPHGIRDPAHTLKVTCTASGYEAALVRPGRARALQAPDDPRWGAPDQSRHRSTRSTEPSPGTVLIPSGFLRPLPTGPLWSSAGRACSSSPA